MENIQIPRGPLREDQWTQFRDSVATLGWSYLEIGLMDDVDPRGGSDTACQMEHERAGRNGELIKVVKEIKPGITLSKTYRVYPPASNPKQ